MMSLMKTHCLLYLIKSAFFRTLPCRRVQILTLTWEPGRGSLRCCPNTSGSPWCWRERLSPSYPSGCQSNHLWNRSTNTRWDSDAHWRVVWGQWAYFKERVRVTQCLGKSCGNYIFYNNMLICALQWLLGSFFWACAFVLKADSRHGSWWSHSRWKERYQGLVSPALCFWIPNFETPSYPQEENPVGNWHHKLLLSSPM